MPPLHETISSLASTILMKQNIIYHLQNVQYVGPFHP